ncbi:MAG: hypothetical protein NUV97_02035 [archaeon]|nr:hypothetical protein [archaeon]MCR4323731.1 hypothetical protein [Nanoarchaeota archaeon]
MLFIDSWWLMVVKKNHKRKRGKIWNNTNLGLLVVLIVLILFLGGFYSGWFGDINNRVLESPSLSRGALITVTDGTQSEFGAQSENFGKVMGAEGYVHKNVDSTNFKNKDDFVKEIIKTCAELRASKRAGGEGVFVVNTHGSEGSVTFRGSGGENFVFSREEMKEIAAKCFKDASNTVYIDDSCQSQCDVFSGSNPFKLIIVPSGLSASYLWALMWADWIMFDEANIVTWINSDPAHQGTSQELKDITAAIIKSIINNHKKQNQQNQVVVPTATSEAIDVATPSEESSEDTTNTDTVTLPEEDEGIDWDLKIKLANFIYDSMIKGNPQGDPAENEAGPPISEKGN